MRATDKCDMVNITVILLETESWGFVVYFNRHSPCNSRAQQYLPQFHHLVVLSGLPQDSDRQHARDKLDANHTMEGLEWKKSP